jgi:hypothetical protein
MKSISHLVVLASLAFSAQAAWSSGEGDTETLNVAAVGSYVSQGGAPELTKAQKAESVLEALGFVGHDGFPSRGGPIDD